MKNYPYVLICRKCEEIIEYKQATRHLSLKHKVKLMGIHNDYIKGIMDTYFKFPVMAYRLEDKKLLVNLEDDYINNDRT